MLLPHLVHMHVVRLHRHRQRAHRPAVHEVMKGEATFGLQAEGARIDGRYEMMCAGHSAARLDNHVVTAVGAFQRMIVTWSRIGHGQATGRSATLPLCHAGYTVCPAAQIISLKVAGMTDERMIPVPTIPQQPIPAEAIAERLRIARHQVVLLADQSRAQPITLPFDFAILATRWQRAAGSCGMNHT